MYTMDNKNQSYSGKSIAQQLLQDTWIGRLLYGKPETYIDGYGVERKDAEFKESANGQLVKDMGKTAKKDALIIGSAIVPQMFKLMSNPAAAKTVAGALVGTALASGETTSDINYYTDIITGEKPLTIGDVITSIAPASAIIRRTRSQKWFPDTSVPNWLRNERLANHATIIGGDRFDIVQHAQRDTYKPRGRKLTHDVSRAREVLDEYTRILKQEGTDSPKLKPLSEEYTEIYAMRPYIIHFLNDGGQLPKFQPGGEISEITPSIVTQDSEFNKFLMTLPDNLRLTPEKDYHMYQYWKLGGKPKDFNEGIDRGMFTWDNSDKGYHAGSIVEDRETGIYHFMKPKHHPTVKYELDWYNKGLETLEGGEQRPLQGEDRKFWEDFRSKYQLDSTGVDYRYVPRNKQGGTLPHYLKYFNYDTTKEK